MNKLNYIISKLNVLSSVLVTLNLKMLVKYKEYKLKTFNENYFSNDNQLSLHSYT